MAFARTEPCNAGCVCSARKPKIARAGSDEGKYQVWCLLMDHVTGRPPFLPTLRGGRSSGKVAKLVMTIQRTTMRAKHISLFGHCPYVPTSMAGDFCEVSIPRLLAHPGTRAGHKHLTPAARDRSSKSSLLISSHRRLMLFNIVHSPTLEANGPRLINICEALHPSV